MLRLFVGVFLPDMVKGHLQKHLDSSPPFSNFRWIDPVSWHITLKFLGSVEESRIPALAAAVQSIAIQRQGLSLYLEKGGAFPGLSEPRIFWTGLGGDVAGLKKLASDVESSVQAVGFPKENRKFKPHVTLAKPRGERSSKEDTNRFCKLLEIYQSPMFDISSIEIVQSQLGPTGSRYTVLESTPLKALT